MNEQNNNESETNFLFFLRLVISNWKFLLATYLTVGIVTVTILMLIPKHYKSEATIVIMEESTSSLTGVLSEFSSLGLGFGTGGQIETYIGYLHTKKMYDRLIEEFNLFEEYEATYREDVYEIIFANLGATDNENKTFSISYTYEEDPEKAAEIVSFLYKELDKIALEVDKAQASNFRTYVENYYQDVRSSLRKNEDSLSRFQARTGLFDLETQVEVTISSLAELEKRKIGLEIEQNYMDQAFQSSSRSREIDNQVSAISNKINSLKKNQSLTLLALDEVPIEGVNFLRLQRDILVGEKVAEFLRLQYEQALLDEQKINSNLYLVDPPKVAQKKFKPQRTKILFIAMFFTITLSLILIRVKEYYRANRKSIHSLFS
ncbi:MAG: hypothetical protein WD059_10400 [Balneolaceae bacterium]